MKKKKYSKRHKTTYKKALAAKSRGEEVLQEMLTCNTTCEDLGTYDYDHPDFTVAEMAEAARAGDACAREVFDISAEKLGEGLSLLCDLLNPEKILIGSVFARCRDLLEEGALRVMRREVHPMALSHVTVDTPALTESIGDMAALAVAAYTLERNKK